MKGFVVKAGINTVLTRDGEAPSRLAFTQGSLVMGEAIPILSLWDTYKPKRTGFEIDPTLPESY